MTTISLTESFGGLEIPAFVVSVLPALPASIVDDEADASLAGCADFEELLTVLSEEDVVVDEDDDDDEDEYRAKLHAQHRDWNSKTGGGYVA